MHLYDNINTYYAIIIIYIIMKLEEYKNLVTLQLMSDNTLHNNVEGKKAYENNKIDQAFENATLFKPITDSNKKLIDRIEKKTEQSDESIKKITDALPIYNTQETQQTHLSIDDKTLHEEPKPSTSNTSSTRNLNIMNIFDNDEESKFINDLMDDKKVYLYTRKKGVDSDESEDVYTDVKLLNLNSLENYSNEQLNEFLKSQELNRITKQLSGIKSHHPSEKINTYIDALRKYKKGIKDYLSSSK